MPISIKDSLKLFGVSIICCCAVLVCTMFLNYALDLKSVGNLIISQEAAAFYDAQEMTSKVVVAVTGLCLLLTSIVTLLFHVKHFIDTHKKDLGILKALGYSNTRIASGFAIFGLSVFIGVAVGFGLAYAIMPKFYAIQNKDAILPNVPMTFHGELLAYFVILPTLAFAILSVLYATYKLKQPVMSLLKNAPIDSKLKHGNCDKDNPFLKGLALSVLKNKKVLAFFICFSAFCFATLIQMGASMEDLASSMMSAMMIIIGVVLAATTLILAVVSVVKSNCQTIAIIRAFGYTDRQCLNSVLGVYRPFAYVGFAFGTVYQYGLLKLMVSIVFKNISGVPEYKFNFVVMAIALAVFVFAYEGLTLLCAKGIKRISLKQIMSQ